MGVIPNGMSSLRYITEHLVEEWENQFAANNREYGNMHQELGPAAQYVDIHRKMAKLRRAVWDMVDTSDWREGPREIAMDMIGHLFLFLELIDRQGKWQQPTRQREEAPRRQEGGTGAKFNRRTADPPIAAAATEVIQRISGDPNATAVMPRIQDPAGPFQAFQP